MARVLLGVTGGIAAYKACELVRLLVKDGPRRHAAPDAGRGALRHARRPSRRSPASEAAAGPLPAPRCDADLLVIAPLSANTLAKLAHGLADNVAHAGGARPPRAGARRAGDERPHVGAPGDAGERRACSRERGVELIGPEEGELAEGERGAGPHGRARGDLRALPRAARRRRARSRGKRVRRHARAGRASRSTPSASSATARPGGWASRSPREAQRAAAPT